MAEFNNDEFIATLTNLSSKQKDINEVTKFMILHYENIELQRKLWEDVFDAVEFEQRITLIYLLNDVIQSSRNSKGNLFVSFFKGLFSMRGCVATGIMWVKLKLKLKLGIYIFFCNTK